MSCGAAAIDAWQPGISRFIFNHSNTYTREVVDWLSALLWFWLDGDYLLLEFDNNYGLFHITTLEASYSALIVLIPNCKVNLLELTVNWIYRTDCKRSKNTQDRARTRWGSDIKVTHSQLSIRRLWRFFQRRWMASPIDAHLIHQIEPKEASDGVH